jgi:hypothetical protein
MAALAGAGQLTFSTTWGDRSPWRLHRRRPLGAGRSFALCLDHLSSEEGSQRRASTGNADHLFAGAFRVSGRDLCPSSTFQACRETSRVPASARRSQNVPVSYPHRIQISPSQATQHTHLQGFCASPLTDSNRRPPPYHAPRSATGRNRWQWFWLVEAVFGAFPFATGCHWLRPLCSITAPSSAPQFRI